MSNKYDEKSTHLRDYWRVVAQSRWMVVSIAAVVITLVTVATYLQTPIYKATATVEIQPRSKSVTPNGDFSQIGVSNWNWMAEDRYLNTQMEVIRSQSIAQTVLDENDLTDAPRFARSTNPAASLAAGIGLKLLPDTYVLEISVEDADPKIAELLANGVAVTYVDANVKSAVGRSKDVIVELAGQTKPLRDEIKRLEQQRIRLAKDANFFAPDEQENSIGSRVALIEGEITNLQISLGEREAVFNAIEEIDRNGGNYESLSVVANDPIIHGIKEEGLRVEQQVDELSATLRVNHPTRQSAEAALEEIPRKLRVETQKIINKFKTEYAVEQRRSDDLERQLTKMREEGLGLAQKVSAIEMLDAEITENRRIYELVTSRIQEITLNQNTVINNIRLLERADVPVFPVRPRKALNLFAGLLLGLFMGVGVAFLIDYLDNTIRSSEDIEQALDLPVLAMVPKTDDLQSSGSKEALQTLRTSVLFASKGRSLNTVHLTSAGPGEGKSRIAVNLAKTLAAAGDRVLLIDADLRRPTVHKHMRLSRDRGLSNYMVSREGGDTWRHWVQQADGDTLDVMTSGPLPPKPAELFGADRFASLITQLKRHYQWVVIDSPPVAALADSLVLGSLAEMTVFVIKHKENDRELVSRSVEALRKVNTNLVGAVLNAVDLKRAAYGDYYYASYEYSEDPKKRAEKSSQASS